MRVAGAVVLLAVGVLALAVAGCVSGGGGGGYGVTHGLGRELSKWQKHLDDLKSLSATEGLIIMLTDEISPSFSSILFPHMARPCALSCYLLPPFLWRLSIPPSACMQPSGRALPQSPFLRCNPRPLSSCWTWISQTHNSVMRQLPLIQLKSHSSSAPMSSAA